MGQHEKPEAPRGRVQARVHLLFVRANTQTDPNTAPNWLQSRLCTAGGLENSGAGEGNRTLVISLGSW